MISKLQGVLKAFRLPHGLVVPLRENWPVALLLAALMTIVHHHQLLREAEFIAVRLVNAGYLNQFASSAANRLGLAQDELERMEQALLSKEKTTFLTITPEGFSEIYQGSIPLARACSARILQTLVAQVETFAVRENIAPVVAIDMDLAPSRGASAGMQCAGLGPSDVSAAIRQLARRAIVILILTPRDSAEALKSRNDFVRGLCTRKKDGATAGVYFADAWLLERALEPIYLYPRRLKSISTAALKEDSSLRQLPPILPSMGELLRAGRSLAKGKAANAVQSLDIELLTSICESVHAGHALVTDRLAALDNGTPTSILDHYELALIDYPASDSGRAANVPVRRLEDLASFQLDSTTLIINLDTPLARDSYFSPAQLERPVSGAEVHYHISNTRNHAPPSHWGSFLQDLALGLIFAVLVHWKPKALTASGYPFSTAVWRRVSPILWAIVLVVSFLHLVRHSPAYWVNPLFVAVGMVIHVYLENNAHGEEWRYRRAAIGSNGFIRMLHGAHESVRQTFAVPQSGGRQRLDRMLGVVWMILVFVTFLYALQIIASH